jgi:formylglycine-generating enzyme required for sulfatase activity
MNNLRVTHTGRRRAPTTPKGAEVCVPDTVLIPGGGLAGAGLGPAVSIAPFRLGRTAVTNREYSSFVACESAPEPPWWRDPRFSSPCQPVVGISWHDATSYCLWLGRITGNAWRLPTEAEWEFAAAAGVPSPPTAWGAAIPPGEIPEGPLHGPWEVGRGTPNGFGLLDMGTIVHEWCLDWRESGGPDVPRRRASRGGSWRHRIRWSSPSARSSLPPDYRYSDYGFRVAVDSPRAGRSDG